MKNILIILFLLISVAVSATTYYIGPSGSDSNNGSSSSPWKTLSYACTKARAAGDIIHVNAGTYAETAQCSLAIGVNIIGAGKTTSIIKSDYYVERTGGDYTGSAIYLNGASEGTMGNQSISNLTIDGDNLTGGIGIGIRQLGGVNIHDCIIKNFYIGGILVSGSSNAFSESSSKALNNQIYNCDFINCSSTANQWNSCGCIGYYNQKGLLIYNNTFDLTYRAKGLNGDILTGGHYCENIKIYNNVFTRLENEMNVNNEGYSFTMETFNTRGGFEIYNNQFYGGEINVDVACGSGDGHYKGSYAYTFYIHDNLFQPTITEQSNNRGAILFEDNNFNDIIVTKNHFKNCAQVFELNSTNTNENSDCSNIEFSYNILENCGWHYNGGYSYNMKIYNGPNEGGIHHIFNNISLYNNVSIGDQVANNAGIKIWSRGVMNNINIKNNIVGYMTSEAPIVVVNDGTISGLHIDYNVLYGNSNSNNPSISGNSISSYSFSNNIKSDPLFVSSSDFHLQAGSPAIGKGVQVAGLVVDYAGNSIKNPPSIGAYESGLVAQAPVVPIYQSAVVQNATPALIELTYSQILANIIPSISAFSVLINSVITTVNSVVISGSKVQLTLASAIKYGDIVTLSYTKPVTNPLQTATAGIATSISAQSTLNNLINSTKDSTPVTISMTTSPSHIHKIVNILLEYTGYSASLSTSMTPQILKISDLSGKLLFEMLLVTGVTSLKIPLNLRSGVYTLRILANGLEMALQKIVVY